METDKGTIAASPCVAQLEEIIYGGNARAISNADTIWTGWGF